ncbi:MAG: NUDIX domain-containing protein [Crocinitomicaceae bacterium]
MLHEITFDQYSSYSFSLGCVIFGYAQGKIQLLVVKHNREPCSGEWAIPGGGVQPNEGLGDAAGRILTELTKLKGVQLHQGPTFGQPDRHPQGRLITTAYFALVRMEDIAISVDVNPDERRWVPVNELPALAFDHNEIVASTYESLRQKLCREPLCFDLLPEKFTLNELQRLYEYAWGMVMDKANFRKKIKSIPLVQLEEKQTNVKHRPANLFMFDREQFKRMTSEESYQFRM